ncbi:hypothetical protein [Shewanella woodyi]|uniref:hypothetical protein n=1 Tax=Shewanella woodyi TaxID=60961 RepID=UPI0007F95457|nr:hypothetical protein [Shewanella woodyi]
MLIVETVSWTAKTGVEAEQMIDAVEKMVPDLQKVPGFRYQSLCLKELMPESDATDSKNQWLQLYYWDTVEAAHKSNAIMAPTDSLNHLISLIEPDSIAIDIFTPLQQSSPLTID